MRLQRSKVDDLPLAHSVLIVDDEPAVGMVLRRILDRETDMFAELAVSAEEALVRLGERRYHLLIADKNLPGIDGVRLIERARQMEPELESMMITGYPTAESLIAALAAGASDYLVKPFRDLAVIRAKVRAAVDRKTERTRSRHLCRALAQRASELLAQGARAGDDSWRALEASMLAYERSTRAQARGTIRLIGNGQAAAALSAAGFDARLVPTNSPELWTADVVVIDTRIAEWRELAEELRAGSAEVLLLAGPTAGLEELLEAMGMRLELVGFAGPSAAVLAERIRTCLIRRAMDQARNDLAQALALVQDSLRMPSSAAGLGAF